MKKKYRKLISWVLAGVFVLGAVLTGRQLIHYYMAARNDKETRKVLQQARQTQPTDPVNLCQPLPSEPPTAPPVTEPDSTEPPTTVPEVTEPEQPEIPEPTEPEKPPMEPLAEDMAFLMNLDYSHMQAINPDMMGWIHIPGTDISYPLMHSKDNHEYLYLAWDGWYNVSGSVFLECNNKRDLSDHNCIIYGHHMSNGLFFGPLLQYQNQEYRDANPWVYIVTDSEVRRYEVFSAYETPTDSKTYWLDLSNQTVRARALEYFVESSVISSDVTPTVDDQILTLSTCTGTGFFTTRWVVQAVLTGLWER